MKYAIIKITNGNYFIYAEGITSIASAKTSFHGLCQVLWNAPDVLTGVVMIIDENGDVVENYKEFIYHEPAPVVTPEPEEET